MSPDAAVPGSANRRVTSLLIGTFGEYRFWARVVQRMRVSGWYLLNPRLVRFKFKQLISDLNPIDGVDRSIGDPVFASLKCQRLPTMDNIVVSVDKQSIACEDPPRRNRSGRRQID